MAFFSSTFDIVVLAVLGVIVLLVIIVVPVLYVTLRKCGVIKVGTLPVTTDMGASAVWHTADSTSKLTQTTLTGHDIDQLQKAHKPSLENYQGKQPLRVKNAKSDEDENLVQKVGTELPPRWRDVDPDWTDPWPRHELGQYRYIRVEKESSERMEEDSLTRYNSTNGLLG